MISPPLKIRQPTQPVCGGTLLVLVIVLIAIFQSAPDVAALMSGGEASLLSYEGPVFIKLAKDILIALLIGSIMVAGITGPRNIFTDASILCFSFIALLFVLSWNENGFLIAASGIRWFAPIALFLLLRAKPLPLHLPTAARILLGAVIACLVLQIFQLMHMTPIYGRTLFDLPARTPGFFLFPNTTAYFVCVSAAVVLVFEPRPWLKLFGLVAATLSVLLTQSGTGIFAVAALATYAGLRKLGPWSAPLAALLLALVFLNLNYITGREQFIQLSGGDRLRVFLDVVLPAADSLDCFGCFTNTANLISNKALTASEGEAYVIDSFISSLIGNLGLFVIPILGCLVYFVHTSCRSVKWRTLLPVLIVYALFSVTTITTEAYPMNVMLPLILWATTYRFYAMDKQ